MTIHDLIIVDELDIEFAAGMTVLTGETGAGKSILIDALSLALGARALASTVRSGRDRADVTTVFDLAALPHIREWMDERELGVTNGDCILRRAISSDGRSRAYINNRPVPASILKELGEQLVDIHGQHAHQSLLHHDTQLRILDEFGGHSQAQETVSRIYREWRTAHAERTASGPHPDHELRLELLRFQQTELQELHLIEGELEDLDAEHKRLSHVHDLMEICGGVLERLSGDSGPSLIGALSACCESVRGLLAHDARLGEIDELLDTATIGLQEATSQLRSYFDRLEAQPERLLSVEHRLSEIHTLARKYSVRPEELLTLTGRVAQSIRSLEESSERARRLAVEIERLEDEFKDAATILHEHRSAAAKKLAERVTESLDQLGMSASIFEVSLQEKDDPAPSRQGSDRVEMLVRTNPGQPLAPLSRIASGGELSRISLALQLATTSGSGVPTLIFDEIDAGIGGRVAEIVGQRLRELGQRRQVFCVTHLPQVASQAHHHVQVQKDLAGGEARTVLAHLSGDERIAEVARMLAGLNITVQALAHARTMLQQK